MRSRCEKILRGLVAVVFNGRENSPTKKILRQQKILQEAKKFFIHRTRTAAARRFSKKSLELATSKGSFLYLPNVAAPFSHPGHGPTLAPAILAPPETVRKIYINSIKPSHVGSH